MSEIDAAQKLREEENDYRDTVFALKALAHELLWDDKKKKPLTNGRSWFGRKLDTSSTNRTTPEDYVTPDLVVQYSDTRGTVAEAKIALPEDDKLKKRRVLEVVKYDDNLRGWETSSERIEQHDLVLLVHHFRAKKVEEIIVNAIKKKEVNFRVPFALIDFAIVLQAKAFISLELLYGSLLDKAKTKKLASRLPIDIGHIAGNPDFASIELYDAQPPTPYLMLLIHTAIFQNLSEKEHEVKRDSGKVIKQFSVDDIRTLVADIFAPSNSGTRTPMIPKKAWVLESLEVFVNLRWAKRKDRSSENFEFEIKNRRDPKRQFIDVCARMKTKQIAKAENAAGQLDMSDIWTDDSDN